MQSCRVTTSLYQQIQQDSTNHAEMMHDVTKMRSKSTARFEELVYGAKNNHRDLHWSSRQTK